MGRFANSLPRNDPEAPTPVARRPFPPLDLLHRLVNGLRQGRIPTGEAAALRRLVPADPDRRHILPLMRLLADVEVEDRPDAWRRLALIANAVALARGLHDPQCDTGRALHALGLSEQRLMALLAADFATLTDLLPRIARRAAATARRSTGGRWRCSPGTPTGTRRAPTNSAGASPAAGSAPPPPRSRMPPEIAEEGRR